MCMRVCVCVSVLDERRREKEEEKHCSDHKQIKNKKKGEVLTLIRPASQTFDNTDGSLQKQQLNLA